MSDFDERLSAVLTAEADDAPHPAGLAQAARQRHVVRRRRRVALCGVAAALVIAAPVAVLAGGDEGDDNLVGDDPTPSSGEWQTVGQGDVRAEIPGDWSKYTCDFDGFVTDVYGPSESEACEFRFYVAFYASATFDPFTRPGALSTNEAADDPAWAGYTYAGDLAMMTSSGDRDLTRRILASARVQGEPLVEAAEWRVVEGVGVRFEVPENAQLGPALKRAGYYVCVFPGGKNDPPERERGTDAGDFATSISFTAGRWVSVAAPTQALQDLVLATVEAIEPGSPDRPIGCVT